MPPPPSGLEDLNISSYSAGLVPSCMRSAYDEPCSLPPALVEWPWSASACRRLCACYPSHAPMGRYLPVGGSRRRHRAQFCPTFPATVPARPTPCAHPGMALIMGSATLCFSRWTQRRRRQLHRFQYCCEHRARPLTEKPLRSRRPVRPGEEKVVNGGEALALARQIEASQLMA